MFLKFFNSANPTVIFFLVLGSLSLWIQPFIQTVVEPQTLLALPFYNSINYFSVHYHGLSVLVAFLIVLAQAFYLNFIAIKYDLLQKNSYISALIYITLMSSSASFLCIHQILICNCFLLPMLDICLSLYEKREAYRDCFYLGFLIAIASMFFYVLGILLFFVWMSFIVFRLLTLREWFIVLMGILVPYLYIFTYFFWFNKLGWLSVNIVSQWYQWHPSFQLPHNEMILFIVIGLVLFIAFFYTLFHINERIILIRKMQYVFIWLMLFSLLILIFTINFSESFLTIIFIPATIFVTNYFTNRKKKWLTEVLYLTLIALIIVFKFI
jgi:hypothetical protein